MAAEQDDVRDSEQEPRLDEDHEADVEVSESSELEATRRELEQTTNSLRRLHADFANFRKRMQAEQARTEARAIADFARMMLPVLDNLELALAALDDSQTTDPASWREGVALVVRQFNDILAGQGITPIESVGQPFDPRIHEAMVQVETDEVPADHVVAEFRRGYQQGDQVLRPSLVSVAKAPVNTDPNATGQQDDTENNLHSDSDVVTGEGESAHG